jgi:hypothetical protein
MESKLGIRWDRVFTTVSGEGQPQSYFKYFLFALAYFYWRIFLEKEKLKQLINKQLSVIKPLQQSNFMTFLILSLTHNKKCNISSSLLFPSISHYVMVQADTVVFEIEDNFKQNRTVPIFIVQMVFSS